MRVGRSGTNGSLTVALRYPSPLFRTMEPRRKRRSCVVAADTNRTSGLRHEPAPAPCRGAHMSRAYSAGRSPSWPPGGRTPAPAARNPPRAAERRHEGALPDGRNTVPPPATARFVSRPARHPRRPPLPRRTPHRLPVPHPGAGRCSTGLPRQRPRATPWAVTHAPTSSRNASTPRPATNRAALSPHCAPDVRPPGPSRPGRLAGGRTACPGRRTAPPVADRRPAAPRHGPGLGSAAPRVSSTSPAWCTLPGPGSAAPKFRNLYPHPHNPARAPKSSTPAPGRPLGSRNRPPTTHHDVGKTTRHPESIAERDQFKAHRP